MKNNCSFISTQCNLFGGNFTFHQLIWEWRIELVVWLSWAGIHFVVVNKIWKLLEVITIEKISCKCVLVPWKDPGKTMGFHQQTCAGNLSTLLLMFCLAILAVVFVSTLGLFFSAFVVRESHEKERIRSERVKYWSIIGSIIGEFCHWKQEESWHVIPQFVLLHQRVKRIRLWSIKTKTRNQSNFDFYAGTFLFKKGNMRDISCAFSQESCCSAYLHRGCYRYHRNELEQLPAHERTARHRQWLGGGRTGTQVQFPFSDTKRRWNYWLTVLHYNQEVPVASCVRGKLNKRAHDWDIQCRF